MAYLQQQASFHSATAAMNTFDDFEAAIKIGCRLLFDRDSAQLSNAIPSAKVHTQSTIAVSTVDAPRIPDVDHRKCDS
jgi:hypothetical protein